MNEIQKQAIEKIEKEAKNYKGDQYGQAVYKPVAATLMQFCQNGQFATAIIDSDKTFSDCIKAVVKDVRDSLPDIEAYKRAVKFYFPTADIKFDMRVILSGEDVEKPVETADNLQEKAEAHADQSDNKIISLFDMKLNILFEQSQRTMQDMKRLIDGCPSEQRDKLNGLIMQTLTGIFGKS